MSTPDGWNSNSWFDVCQAQERAAHLVSLLRVELAKLDPSRDYIVSLFDDLLLSAEVGSTAAKWGKP